ncbi:MAG: hypothetical protein ABW277_08050 [Longimicrobiaceae bacterium]
MMENEALNAIDGMEIEPLSDELLENVAGASSTGPACCSCSACSNAHRSLSES